MSATLEHLQERVRLELGDQPRPFETEFFTDGIEVQYRIDYRPVQPESIVMTLDGVPTTEYELDARHGIFLFREVLPEGVVVNVAGVKYRYFNNDDLSVFCQESVAEHATGSVDHYGIQMTLDRIPVVQHHVVALRATVLALWALVTDAAFDIDIFAPDGVNIPRSERFRQLMELIGGKQGEYDALSKALNIGIFRIEVFTFRRIARLTNRLVPLYMEQEFDDPRPPTRLYTEISTQQYTQPISASMTIDLVMRKDAYFEQVIVLNQDLRDCLADPDNEVRAEVLLFPGQSVPRATFTVVVLDASTGTFKISLTPDESKFVPTSSYWQMLIRNDTAGGILLAQGAVQAMRPVGHAGISGSYNSSYQIPANVLTQGIT